MSARKVRYVTDEEFKSTIVGNPDFHQFPDTGGHIIACPFCGSENSAVYYLDDVCQSCEGLLKGGDRFVGLLDNKEIWVTSRSGPENK